jgi:hypothetical protein
MNVDLRFLEPQTPWWFLLVYVFESGIVVREYRVYDTRPQSILYTGATIIQYMVRT